MTRPALRARILAALPAEGRLTHEEIAEQLHVGAVWTIRRELRRMQADGLVETCLCGCRGDTWRTKRDTTNETRGGDDALSV